MIQRCNSHIYIILFFLILMIPLAYSQEVELNDETIKFLRNVLMIEFEVKLIQPGEGNPWKSKIIKYTIPGYTVILKVEGTNIKFKGHFTPYLKGEELLLIAQGQVWLSDPSKKSLTFFTCVRSISLAYEEKVVFLPLGITEEYEKKETYNIEIEIQIFQYSYNDEENQD